MSYILLDSDESCLSNFDTDKVNLIGKKLTNGGSTGGDIEIEDKQLKNDYLN